MHSAMRPASHYSTSHVKKKLSTAYDSYMVPHAKKKGLYIIHRFWEDQLAVVEPQTDPEIIHQDREARHNGDNAPGPAKFISELHV
jgi:hypothetical protein